jgi:D-beta-D-heptose 7-phosphate kinase/D-beta-D-heptose 1-phosphate adenosyltransferase
MLPWLSADRALKIAVIGDIILDEYLEGRVERISPEAPVPINLIKHTSLAAGGAANSALNIAQVGACAVLFGVWGKDAAAESLAALLASSGIDFRHVISSPDRPTVRKTRVTSGHQQMLRIDWEQTQGISLAEQHLLIEALRSEELDGILVSDYGKGLLQQELLSAIFALAQEKAIPCVVDPKGLDFSKYRGCSLITPNYAESCAALGLKVEAALSGEQLGSMLQKRYGLEDVLVTMGAMGMVYLPAGEGKEAIFRSPRAREVYDVSGAGDTVAALMALSLAAKIAPRDAVDLATLAAGIVVEKRGTQPVQRHELEERLARGNHALYSRLFGTLPHSPRSQGKLVTPHTLALLMRQEQAKGRSFVFTNGCFDILHAGHVSLLEQAKSFGSYLIVAVNTDESVRSLNKGEGRPIVPLADRMQVLAALSCVDYVVSFAEETPLQVIEELLPDVLVKGGDYSIATIVGARSVLARGGKVEIIDLLPERSTSAIVKAIRTQEQGAAARGMS